MLKSKISEADIIKAVRTKISAVRPEFSLSSIKATDYVSAIRQFKCPDRIFILESIPKTATGKIQRKALAVRRWRLPQLD